MMNLCENMHIHEAIEPRPSINLSVYPHTCKSQLNNLPPVISVESFASLKFVIVTTLDGE